MEPYLAWAGLGLVLIVVELLTTTFYLLVFGIACFGASAAALAGAGFELQAVVAALVGGGGAYAVRAYRARNRAQQMAPVDRGQPASFESWVDEPGRLARVRYRGASWEAHVEGDPALQSGATVYVLSVDGNTLTIAKTRPA